MNRYSMFPRKIQKHTPLIHEGRLAVTIIYPSADAGYARLAQKLAGALQKYAANPARLLDDRTVMPAINTPLPDEYRSRPLILLGNLNNNRAVLTLYARYYCFTDALYPGGSGYDLRTMVNPYGRGANVILAGGSSLQGVERAVDRLIQQIETAGKAGELDLPFLLEVELEPALRQRLYGWSDAPLNVPLPADPTERLKCVGAYSMMYAATGDPHFGEFAATCLRLVNAQLTDSYGDRHYFIERIMRAIPWLGAGGFLDDADILRTDQLLLGMALGSEDAWWRMRSAKPPLGHRHHGKGTYEFYLIARFLREQAAPDPEVARMCDRWIDECQAFLDALGRAGIDDQDDESTLNNISTVFWYSLSEERYDFFESGGARSWAQRVVALHDNLGAAAGPGGYGESLLGMTYIQEEAATPVAACAFYYQDGRFKWILEKLPRLNPPLRGGFWSYCPIFIHKFDTGPELVPLQPEGLTGLQVLPTTLYQVELNNNPPEHIEYAGHMVNAPETWRSPEGVGKNRLPREKGFDKVVLRGGYQREDPYLIIQGYQGGFRWQGHMKAANCILRFSQAGHIFLMQNTRAHSQWFKNGILVSDGFNMDPIPPLAEWLALDDFEQAGLSVTRLGDYHHTTWTRHLFWSKSQGDVFVVIDCITPEAEGDYSAVCTWRTLGYASLRGRTWRADQGSHSFILRSSETLQAICEEERDLGAANPYVLHQLSGGHYRSGETVSFQNLLYVRAIAGGEEIDLRRLGPEQALVLRERKASAWVGVSASGGPIRGLGLEIQAFSAWAAPGCLILAGATRLKLPGSPTWSLSSPAPVGLEFDFTQSRLRVRIDGPACQEVTLSLAQGEDTQIIKIEGQNQLELSLPPALSQQWSGAVARVLTELQPEEAAQDPALQALAGQWSGAWKPQWQFNGSTGVPERVRNLTVAASPLPLDGIPEQLIDTVPLEIREIWQHWPQKPEYKITLTFPQEKAIESLNLIGDSRDEPYFKVFSPLPEGIQVTASSDGFQADLRPCRVESLSGETSFKRFRGILDRMESRRVAVNQKARQVQLTIPAPPSDRPLVFQEVEVYGAERVLPGINYLSSADLEGRGRCATLVVTGANELITLDDQGTELWRYQFPGEVSHISCHDLFGDGRQYLCAGIPGGYLIILSPDGKEYKHLSLANSFFGRSDVFFGWLYSIHSICVWQRDASGRAALALGSYSVVVFLDSAEQLIGHSWADAPWILNLLSVPPGETGAGDLWARCGWNHGIGRYEGRPGFEPSGEGVVFGGVRQPMFRALRKIIPFVNGRTAAFDWFTANQDLGRVIVAAAEDGVGVLSTRTHDFLWRIEGGTTLTACMAVETGDGQGAVLTGGVDGFVAAFSLSSGKPLRRWWAGAPVVGLVNLPKAGVWVTATRQGVWALDSSWQVLAFYPLEAARICAAGDRGVTVACQDGTLLSLQIGG